MTSNQAIEDINYAANIAKSAKESPLVGGPFGLMWGVLLSITLGLHWAIINGEIATGPESLGYLWLAFAIVGGIGNAVLGFKVVKKPGVYSTANKVEQSVWIMFAVMMGSLFVGVICSMIFGSGTLALFDLVPIVGFGGQGLAYGVTARTSHYKWLYVAAAASFTASIICLTVFGQSYFYLVASICALITIVPPAIKTMRAEHVA
jgi:hypothetical protein